MERKEKTGRKENPGESFLSRAHNFHPPKSRGKCCERTFIQIPSPNVYNNPTRQNKKEVENNHQTQHHHQTPELSTEN